MPNLIWPRALAPHVGATGLIGRTVHWLGVAPPYWRFLPTFLSIPPLPALRARSTGVSATRKNLFVSPIET